MATPLISIAIRQGRWRWNVPLKDALEALGMLRDMQNTCGTLPHGFTLEIPAQFSLRATQSFVHRIQKGVHLAFNPANIADELRNLLILAEFLDSTPAPRHMLHAGMSPVPFTDAEIERFADGVLSSQSLEAVCGHVKLVSIESFINVPALERLIESPMSYGRIMISRSRISLEHWVRYMTNHPTLRVQCAIVELLKVEPIFHVTLCEVVQKARLFRWGMLDSFEALLPSDLPHFTRNSVSHMIGGNEMLEFVKLVADLKEGCIALLQPISIAIAGSNLSAENYRVVRAAMPDLKWYITGSVREDFLRAYWEIEGPAMNWKERVKFAPHMEQFDDELYAEILGISVRFPFDE